ncbi:MAG: tRNA (adenosine(37)-N6)-threonylcarbamoyltransferase complex transferase subunit TsaD, partial [Acidimicrobiia bacterium]|nr:tRNA (adenosine(37)-N6)-threonylcarbamoyltransferase complex transferase subunit TsaD [Acidimicrobiia bacterium]
MTTILGIETSCDETAAAVVVDGLDIRSNVISTQVELHARFGGVVPEVASRAHLESINAVITRALDEAGSSLGDLDAVAACHGPGLAGALLVGVSAGKALALVLDVPYVGVHHLEAHLHAAWLEDPSVEMPMAVLLVSGGHTMIVSMEGTGRYRILGQTVDDAAGEAYDKVARALGLGYPGGPVIDRIAKDGDPTGVVFPRPMLNEGLDFSFSGLKTAVMLEIRRNPDRPAQDIAASFQEAVVETLVYKLEKAADQIGARTLVLGGGVAANSRLRARVAEVAEKSGRRALLPRHDLCTDNGAMIAAA